MSQELVEGQNLLKKAVKFIYILVGVQVVGSLVTDIVLFTTYSRMSETSGTGIEVSLIPSLVVAGLIAWITPLCTYIIGRFIKKGNYIAAIVWVVFAIIGIFNATAGFAAILEVGNIWGYLLVICGVASQALNIYVAYLLWGTKARLVFMKKIMEAFGKDMQAIKGDDTPKI